MQKKKICNYWGWFLVFIFVCFSVFVMQRNIESIYVKIDGNEVAKGTYTIENGRKTVCKVSVVPRTAKKKVTYTSSKKSVATISKKGTITAKKAGTARIKITVSGKGFRKKTTWVKIKVINSTVDASTAATMDTSTAEDTLNESQSNTEGKSPVITNEKALIVYFSRTGTTKAVAEEIQNLTGGDLAELKTVMSYPSSYDDCLAQAQQEKASNARPELSTTIDNMSEYSTIYVGYPIWCYTAPMAVFTFLESYDFTDKTIFPFCTSGSSSITESVDDIRSICSDAYVSDGFRANGSKTVEEWLEEIGQIGDQRNTTTENILIAYFSLSENTASSKEEQSRETDAISSASVVTNEGSSYGNTEYIANMIQEKTGGTLYRIQTKELYSTDFNEVIDQNHTEMDTSSLPELKESSLNINDYDIVFLGYPVWASTIPRAIHSFLNQYDLSGKTVIPFCTHNGYGSGNSYRMIAELCPNAVNLDGFAVESTEIENAKNSVEQWLDELNLSFKNQKNKSITIKTGTITIDGILYDTKLAEEISADFPLTVSMVGFGGREYYGSLSKKPQTAETGNYNFEDGDITYCAQNNTIAIFYAQTDRPNLTMEVVPIGKVTSDLSVFQEMDDNITMTFELDK